MTGASTATTSNLLCYSEPKTYNLDPLNANAQPQPIPVSSGAIQA